MENVQGGPQASWCRQVPGQWVCSRAGHRSKQEDMFSGAWKEPIFIATSVVCGQLEGQGSASPGASFSNHARANHHPLDLDRGTSST